MDPTNMPRNNNSICNFTDDFNYLLPITYSMVLVVGLLLNLTAMYAIVFRLKDWSPNTIYMMNLTVCDTLYILTLPFLIYYHFSEKDWPFTEAFCKFIRFLFYTNLYGSILFLTCINVHRFIVICHPVRSRGWVNPRRARYVSVLVWVVVLIFQSPVLYFPRLKDGETQICTDTTTEDRFEDFLEYSIVILVTFFIIPFVLVIVCNSLIVRKLKQPSKVGGAISQRSKQKSVRMIVIVLLVFIICFVPFHITRILSYIFRYNKSDCELRDETKIGYTISRALASINSCTDPILYFLAGQGFRSSLPKMKKDRTTEEYKGVSSLE